MQNVAASKPVKYLQTIPAFQHFLIITSAAAWLTTDGKTQHVIGHHTALGAPPVKFGAYLNGLGIVVLAEPSEPFSEVPSQEDPEAFGMDFIGELSEPKGTESEAGDGPFL